MDLIIYIYERMDSLFGNGASEEEINVSETFLETKLALEYKRFLKEFGYVELKDHDLAGLGGSDYFNFLVLTTKAKNRYKLDDCYVIEELDDEEYIIQNKTGEVFKISKKDKIKLADSILEYLI